MILTGLSGSGKGSVLNTFEDLGFYCVDNLPVALIPTFSELYDAATAKSSAPRCWWTRAKARRSKSLPGIYRKHLRSEHPATLVFIEASDEALLRRFSETRRPHPLGAEHIRAEGISRRAPTMAPIRRLADVVIDTTKFNVHELRQFVTERFRIPTSAR